MVFHPCQILILFEAIEVGLAIVICFFLCIVVVLFIFVNGNQLLGQLTTSKAYVKMLKVAENAACIILYLKLISVIIILIVLYHRHLLSVQRTFMNEFAVKR